MTQVFAALPSLQYSTASGLILALGPLLTRSATLSDRCTLALRFALLSALLCSALLCSALLCSALLYLDKSLTIMKTTNIHAILSIL